MQMYVYTYVYFGGVNLPIYLFLVLELVLSQKWDFLLSELNQIHLTTVEVSGFLTGSINCWGKWSMRPTSGFNF